MDHVSLAHACFVLGELQAALEIARSIRLHDHSSWQLQLAAARLEGEIHVDLQLPDAGLDLLHQALERAPIDSRRRSQGVVGHARSIEVLLLTSLGRFDEAETISHDLVRGATRAEDHRGLAVALVRLGIVSARRSQWVSALDLMESARHAAMLAQDRRAHAWAEGNAGIVGLELGRDEVGIPSCLRSLALKQESGEGTLGYLCFLQRIVALRPGAFELAQAEIERVTEILQRAQLAEDDLNAGRVHAACV